MRTRSSEKEDQDLGPNLYNQVSNAIKNRALAAKITGMLQALDRAEQLHLLDDAKSLESKIAECSKILQTQTHAEDPSLPMNDPGLLPMLHAVTSATPGISDANTSSAAAPNLKPKLNFLRLPAYVKRMGLPETVPILPMEISTALVSSDQFFGIRCRDHFVDAIALMTGERGYVKKAVKSAREVILILCPGRDPILLLKDLQPVEITHANHANRIKILRPPEDNDLKIDIPYGTPKQTFCVQLLGGILPQDHVFAKRSVEMKFKNYRSIEAENVEELKALVKDLDCVVCPRKFITSHCPTAHGVCVSISKTTTASAVARNIRDLINFVHISSSGTIRIFVEQVSQALVDQLLGVNGVDSITDEDSGIRKASKSKVYAPNNNRVIVKKVDGNPIPETLFEIIVQKLKVTRAKFINGCILGDIHNASSLHEKTFGDGQFAILALALSSV